MMKTITITAYNRPRNFQLLLDSLRDQILPLDEYKLYIKIDPGGSQIETIKAMAEAVDFVETEVRCDGNHLGLNRATYASLQRVFEEGDSDFNVYLEEDFLLSPDAFHLAEWYIKNDQFLQSQCRADGAALSVALYGLVNLYTRNNASREEVFMAWGGGMWGFVVSRPQWIRYVKDGWLSSGQSWDAALAEWIRRDTCSMRTFPDVSRISNTGFRGEHSDPASLSERLRYFEFNQDKVEYQFRYVGLRSQALRQQHKEEAVRRPR